MQFSKTFKNIQLIRDTDEQLRSHILWFIFIRVILFTLLLGISFALQSRDRLLILPPPFIILAFIFTIYTFSIGSALYLRRGATIRLRRLGGIQILADTFFMSLLVFATGCSQSIFTSIYILPIIAGGLILYRIGGLVTAAAATIQYGTVLAIEYLQQVPLYFYSTRYIPVYDYIIGMNVFAVYGLTFFLIAMLSGMLAQRLRTTEDALTLTEMKFDNLLLLYKQIFDDIVTGIITVDKADRITSFNPAAEHITGYSQAETIGRPLKGIFPALLMVSNERHIAELEKKDGTSARVGFSCSALHVNPGEKKNPAASTDCKVITLQDISRVEEMERQMRQAEKMAAIGELSASIAHDFRNPLAAISGSAQILAIEEEQKVNDPTRQNLTRIILRESERMARTITDFLDYARPATPEPEWFNLLKLARESIGNITRDKHIDASCVILPEIPEDLDLYADRQLIQLTLCHLLKNSCHASRNRNAPIIVSAHDDPDNDRVILEVRDEGEGFAPEIKEKLTIPFFSTREDAAGLGLSVVQQTVERHEGRMEISGENGRGCTVRIILPQPGAALRNK